MNSIFSTSVCNLFYVRNLSRVGGVTSFLYYLCKKYPNKITILYLNADEYQLIRLSEFAVLKKFNNQHITCERLFVNYAYEDIKGYIHAKEKYWIVHANYNYLKSKGEYNIIPQDFKVIAVSKYAGDNCGREYEVCYNPVVVEEKPCFLIVSATRLGFDKGSIKERMEKLSRRLTQRGISFIWLCFTDDKVDLPNIICMPSKLDISPFLKRADFVAQLSDSEACCLTAMESLSLETPMLATKVPSFYEQGMNEKNTIFFDFDMSNMDECIDRMFEKFSFKYSPPKDRWDELLINKKEEIVKMKSIKVKATSKWKEGGGITCKDTNTIPNEGDEFVTTEDRANMLISAGYAILVGVEEPKEEIKEETKKKKAK